MKTFNELNLIQPLQRALAAENYHTPTRIQAKTIPDAVLGHDILGCAQTGTGKTAAFALPILHAIGERPPRALPRRPIGLILAPTRELAIQIGESFATYGRHLNVRQTVIYGGVNQLKQVRALERGVHLVIATPGRLLDLMNQGHLSLGELKFFVLDEVDRMLDMGFLPDLRRIIERLPRERQSLFFSATLPPKIVELAEGLLRNPRRINVTPKSPSLAGIDQGVLFVESSEKRTVLRKVLSSAHVDQALVFTRTKRSANALAEKLKCSGISAAAIHGNKSQNARQRALAAFRRKEVRVLVATDVAARGIDIDGITHVINFDLPHEPESYVHRIGRTGRAGSQGTALSFCMANERPELRAIENLIGKALTQLKPAGQPSDEACAASMDGPRNGFHIAAAPGHALKRAATRPRTKSRFRRRKASRPARVTKS